MIKPKVSIVMATYNRAHTLPRAIDSVLAQDYTEWELIVIDDGSTDNTEEIMRIYTDPRIKYIRFKENRGVCAAKNSGFDHIAGEWFTTLDSDDEMVLNALSTMLNVPSDIDSSIDVVKCNCIDTSTGNLSGIGLEHDQFVDFEKSMSCSGEHWGINKTSSLGKLRFNENINGFEGIVWQKISKNAHCYYIHKALRIYHTEGEDRLCNPKKKVVNYEYICKQYREICKESEYLNYLREYRLTDYASMMFYIVLVSLIDGNLFEARKFYKECKIIISVRRSFILKVFLAIGSAPAKVFFRLYWHSKSVVSV